MIKITGGLVELELSFEEYVDELEDSSYTRAQYAKTVYSESTYVRKRR